MPTDSPNSITEVVETWRSGPLPTARELAAYDAVIPDLAERIIRQWESETLHRRGLERAIVEAGLSLQRRGQWIAGAIAFVAIVGGIVLSALGSNAVGLAAILVPLAGIAAAFVWGQIRAR